MTPIIIHPERNHATLNDPNKLLLLAEKGVLAQLTAKSYVSSFGKKIQKLSKQLIEGELVHLIVSDAHNTTTRSFYMEKAYHF